MYWLIIIGMLANKEAGRRKQVRQRQSVGALAYPEYMPAHIKLMVLGKVILKWVRAETCRTQTLGSEPTHVDPCHQRDMENQGPTPLKLGVR